jgi:hypothetical protein
MKTMTIWQRLHTTLAALIVLLLIGVGIAWWVENTRSKTQLRSDQLMNAGDHIRRGIVHLGDCVRWRTQSAPKQEQKKRVEELKADVISSVETIHTRYEEYPRLLAAAKAVSDYATRLADAFDKETKELADNAAGTLNPAPAPASASALKPLLDQQKRLFDSFNEEILKASTAELGKSPAAAFIGGGCLLVILVSCVFVGRLQSKAINRPLSLLMEALERMRGGDFTQKVSLS